MGRKAGPITITPITDEDDFKYTRVIGNEMYFFGDIDSDNVLEFTEEFKKLSIVQLSNSVLQRLHFVIFHMPSLRCVAVRRVCCDCKTLHD